MAEQPKTSKKSALSSSVTNDDKIKAVKFKNKKENLK